MRMSLAVNNSVKLCRFLRSYKNHFFSFKLKVNKNLFNMLNPIIRKDSEKCSCKLPPEIKSWLRAWLYVTGSIHQF